MHHIFAVKQNKQPLSPVRSVRSRQPTARNEESLAPGRGLPVFLQAKRTISEPGDPYELEADRVADQAMRVPEARLQRACVCGGGCPKCQTAQRDHGATPRYLAARAQSQAPTPIPASVEQAIASPGEALEDGPRSFMERRFGADFATVRVHQDARAAQSARDVGARAYTVGTHIVFGKGEYDPHGSGGRELLAHELAHTLQQGGASTRLQRACLSAAECATPQATLENFVAETEAKPENVSKADKRKKACAKTPPDAACTSDGHGAKATALTALLTTHYKSRLGHVTGIFVHKDMPADWGAVTMDCASFTPPLPGGKCTFAPDRLEAQAKQYQSGSKTIGSASRQDWLTSTLGTLTHETEHARFDTAAPIARPTATACKFEDHESNLSEMAAHLSEMHVYYRDALARPEKGRFKQFYQMFDYWVKNGSEDISGIVKDLRCNCDCSDADHYITKTSESVSSSQKWDTNEAFLIHTELRDPKWGLKWPVAPPASVNIADLPNAAAAPFKLE